MRTRNRWAAVVCAAFVGATPSVILAQQPATAARPAARPTAEGINVSGYWVIDVRNPDGSLASHTEFENALTSNGQLALVNVMNGGNVFGAFSIHLSGTPQPCSFTLPLINLVEPVFCFLGAPGLTMATQTNPAGAVVLTGATTANNTGEIDSVTTFSRLSCGLGIVPCGLPADDYDFTSFSLNGPGSPVQPIPVTPGQLIQVSVTLSFS